MAHPQPSHTKNQVSQEQTFSQHQHSTLSVPDRFRQIQDHVASLDFSQRSYPAESSVSGSRLIDPQAHAKLYSQRSQRIPRQDSSSKAVPPSQPNGQIVAELLDETEDIEEFMSKSRRLHEERHKINLVAVSTKENELVLRLQQAQRHILQLKRHIQDADFEVGCRVDCGNDNTPTQIGTDYMDINAEDVLIGSNNDQKAAENDTVSIPRPTYLSMQKELKVRQYSWYLCRD